MAIRRVAIAMGVFWLVLLGGCAGLPTDSNTEKLVSSPWATASGVAVPSNDAQAAATRWQHFTLPGKASTQFEYARKDGRDAVRVNAPSSASMLRYPLQVAPTDLGHIRFSWLVPELIAGADMAMRDADDSPVRIVLAFDGDRTKLSARHLAMSELAKALTGEDLPYATLMYVWCNTRAPGTVIHSPRTDRIRMVVAESGPKQLGQWLDYERDVRADFERAFGEAPGTLMAVGIMTDSDNTRTTAKAWYGPVRLRNMVAAKTTP